MTEKTFLVYIYISCRCWHTTVHAVTEKVGKNLISVVMWGEKEIVF